MNCRYIVKIVMLVVLIGVMERFLATWEDFINCDFNQANNRQIRMLADYCEIGCETLKC
jgi:hypothetical protein